MPDGSLPDQIPAPLPAIQRWATDADSRGALWRALEIWKQDGPGQTAGRFFPVACVALEITQRCNLDCSLCYLSENAEAAHDVPLPLLLERIDRIAAHYGPSTTVQITGGDPTLRSADDLQAICRHIRKVGLRSCLMTNGIRATRSLLEHLGQAGLDDVAFHVDLTQERKRYASEHALNAVRSEYLARARGLGLRVMFNTTVFDGNVDQITEVARFFRSRAPELALVSFQMQIDTGRGTHQAADPTVTVERVMSDLSTGMGTELDFGTSQIGHRACTKYATLFHAGDRSVSTGFARRVIWAGIAALSRHYRAKGQHLDRPAAARTIAWRDPLLTCRTAWLGLRLLARLAPGLIHSRGRIHRTAVVIHDFMDAARLDRGRCESCVFMVATAAGPVSMCAHNAYRDALVFRPVETATAQGRRWWHAATGQFADAPSDTAPGPVPRKRLKGRARIDVKLDG